MPVERIARILRLGRWERLGVVALLSLYFSLFLFPVVRGEILVTLGVDYRVIWSAGYIANRWGYGEVYDLARLAEVQSSLPVPEDSAFRPIVPIPSPYPPVFMIPFQIMALFPLSFSFWTWQFLNFTGLCLYLFTYLSRLGVRDSWQKGALVFLTGCLFMPVFTNFWEGQVNLWLMICVGEFFLSLREGRWIKAGLWLSGLSMKPQFLLLLLPAVLQQRAWKVMYGFGLGALLVGVLSVIMLGKEGIQNYVMMLRWSGDLESPGPGISPQTMVNWRMSGFHLASLLPYEMAWGVALTGMMLTALLVVWLWRRPILADRIASGIALFGTLAGTCAFAWHSHQHAMMILVPLFLFLWTERLLPPWLVRVWLFLLPAGMLLMYTLALLSVFGLPVGINLPVFAFALTGLMVNLTFLVWSVRQLSFVQRAGS